MEVYAELTRKQLNAVESGDMEFSLPNGVKMSRRRGSRACYFQCADEDALVTLIDGLEASWITWQENLSDSEYKELAESRYYDQEKILQEIVCGSGRYIPPKRVWAYEQKEISRKSRNDF